MSKFQIPKIKTQEEYIANMKNLVKQYPFHMDEINQLLPYGCQAPTFLHIVSILKC